MLCCLPGKDPESLQKALNELGKGSCLFLPEGGLDAALGLSGATRQEILFAVEGEEGTALYSLWEFQPWGSLPLPRPFYLFCEGAVTEANYFRGFQRALDQEPVYRGMLTIVPCASNTTQIVREAERYAEKHLLAEGEIWCVFDKDDFPVERFNQAVQLTEDLTAASAGVSFHAAWSNECFEIWFVLHFADYRSNNHREQYLHFLKKKLGRYRKNQEDLFDRLLEKGDPRLAIRYARRILEESAGRPPGEIAPGTTVFRLVEELAAYLPEDLRNRFLTRD